MMERSLHAGFGSFSLCHGLAGNGEILLYGLQVLRSEWGRQAGLAIEVASTGIEAYSKPSSAWPCGIDDCESPGLMIGLAGIGRFYLRMRDSAIPSVLVLDPGVFLSGLAG
jgi:lantibiotic modifying enzyme